MCVVLFRKTKMYSRIQVIDFCSACLTFGMFIYTIVEYKSLSRTDLCYYKTQTIWTDDSDNKTTTLRNSISVYKQEIDNYCVEKGGKLQQIEKQWSDVTHKGSYVTYKNSCYNPLWFLLWIFFVAFMCQLQRACCYDDNDNDSDDSILTYVPKRGPQIVRWLEYTLTTPLQVILIASSFFVADLSVLLLLATLQGLLVLTGYFIELILENINTRKYNDKHNKNLYIVWYVFGVASFVHGVIWWVLIDQFNETFTTFGDCGGTMQIPTVVTAILWSEFTLFTLFGAVQFFHLLHISTDYANETEPVWEFVTECYSILSVISKTILGILFIALVKASP